MTRREMIEMDLDKALATLNSSLEHVSHRNIGRCTGPRSGVVRECWHCGRSPQ